MVLPKVAFIGTGLMGRPMVRRLLAAGVSVTAFNRSPGPLSALAEVGAQVAVSAAQAVDGAEVVITMLPNGDVVREVLRQGALDVARPGTLFIDMSSIHPALAREHTEWIAAEDCRSLDAPVSGGTVGAAAGTLAIMVGGNEADFERSTPLFELMGRPTLVGPHGAGQLCKLVNQAIVAVTIGAVAEGLSLARAGGADPVRVRQAIMGGFAQSRILEIHGQRMNERRFEPGGTITNQVKDLDAVLNVAASAGLTLPLSQRVHDLFGSMLEAGEGHLDHSALILELDRL